MMAILEETVGDEPAEFYLGGYGKFDNFAYSCCQKYKITHPNVSLVFVTPYLRDAREGYDAVLYPAIEDKPLKFAISYRNRYMAEKADLAIAYICRTYGGAYTMYKHIEKKGRPICNLADSPLDNL